MTGDFKIAAPQVLGQSGDGYKQIHSRASALQGTAKAAIDS